MTLSRVFDIPHNQDRKRGSICGKKPVIIYPTLSKMQKIDVDFYLLRSFLQTNGIKYEMQYYDLNAVEANYLVQFTEQFKEALIYIHISDITHLSKFSSCLLRLKQNKSFIILGGSPAITTLASDILSRFDSIDVVVRNPESGKVLLRLINGLRKNRYLKTLKGITFRQHDANEIVTTPSSPLSKKLDDICLYKFIDRQIFDNNFYPLVTSRGCHHNCQYCGLQVPYRMNYSPDSVFWRRRSVKAIVDEMEHLITRGNDRFVFYCEQFFKPDKVSLPNDQAKKIADEIRRRKLKPKLSLIAKPSELLRNFPALLSLVDAGLENVDIGIDSGLERFHRMYETGSSVEDNLEVLKRMHEHHLHFDISFVFFDPYLTIQEIEVNLTFLEKISEYFSHLELPYSDYLISRVLKNTLILRQGMPIMQRLKRDDLVEECPFFSVYPSMKFKNSQVEKIYAIYKTIDTSVIPFSRTYLKSKIMIEKNPLLNLFPLEVMRKIVNDVVDNRVTFKPKYILEIAAYFKKNVQSV